MLIELESNGLLLLVVRLDGELIYSWGHDTWSWPWQHAGVA
jgi:hypothetical protein